MAASPRLGVCRRNAVSLFATFVLLLSAIIPSWHATQRPAASASALAELQVLLGDGGEASAGFICHHKDGGTSDLPGDDGSPLCKKPCPLCLALQHHSPAVTPRGIAWPAFTGIAVTAFVPHCAELEAGRSTAEEGRPRAPPSA